MKKKTYSWLSTFVLALWVCAPSFALADDVQWINHLGFLPGDSSVKTEFNAVNSGVGGGLSGLVVTSTTTGEEADGGGNKVIEQGVQVPPGFLVSGVRVCYELSSSLSYISQIRIGQLQDPPDTALMMLDDGTDLVDVGPICVNSAEPFSGPINPAEGALRLSLRVNFGDINDSIVVRGVGLLIVPDPDSPLQQLLNHTHDYLTGKGVGHNKVVAATGGPVSQEVAPEPVVPAKNNGKKPKK